jgi:aminoglycoside phosphotransferase (APT) family kinase protein
MHTQAGTTIRETGKLSGWLQSHVPSFVGPFELTALQGGQSNPTYRLESVSHTLVLRRKPEGQLLASAHAVDREFRIVRALENTAIPVAHVYGLCEDDAVIGSAFYVMDFVDGRHFMDPRLPGMSPADRSAVFDSMNDVIANLHTLDPAAVGLADFGRPGNFVERQLARWSRQYRASETEPIEAMDRLIEWLPHRVPVQVQTSIVHGDYKLDNMIVHKTEPRIVALLDWELSTLGDPLVDFAYHAMAWRIAPDLFRGLAGTDLAALGIPSEDDYLNAYCQRCARQRPANWDFYIVFCMFRIAAILQGILKRAEQGTAVSDSAIDVGGRGRFIAQQAWDLASVLT